MGVQHDREPHYPKGNLRADFRIGATFVEFIGLKGQPECCESAGIRLVLIEPKDLADRTMLMKKLAELLTS